MRRTADFVRCVVGAVVLMAVPASATGQGLPSSPESTESADSAAVVYRIESVPYGAEVRLVTPSGTVRRLGTTPLDLRVAAPLDGVLVVRLDGYAEARVTPGRGARTVHRIPLDRLPDAAPPVRATRVEWRPSRWWLDAIAVGVAIAGTAYSVDQKTRADDLYETYRETGDPALRPAMRRHDTRAFVGLGVGTAGLGVFAVRLALRR